MNKKILMFFFLAIPFFLVGCGVVDDGDDRIVKQKIFENLDGENILEDTEGSVVGKGEQNFSQKFKFSGLQTNTDKTSIDLDLVLGGGPAKDGIPSIDKPEFYSIEEAEEKLDFLNNRSTGIAVEIGGEARFYPYNILVWHEIVNDTLGGKDIAVTFCPLCGSAVVYNRDVDGEKVRFGVSGKLYESNLLMYDDVTESLWSQSIGEALVGEKLGNKLEYIQSNLMSFEEFKNNYSSGKILTDNTGARRNYSQIPYGDYTEIDDLYFPVTNSDERFQAKEMFYIVNNSGESVAFKFDDLREEKKAELAIGENSYSASFENGILEVDVNGKKLAGYYEMWFSWVTHNKGSKNVWKGPHLTSPEGEG